MDSWEKPIVRKVDFSLWHEDLYSETYDFFDSARVRNDMPSVPFVYDNVKELMTLLVTSKDGDAWQWAEYICTREGSCKVVDGRLLLPENPQHILTRFRKWICESSYVMIEKWGQPTNVKAPLEQSASFAVRWVYAHKAEYKTCMVDGTPMIAVKRAWAEKEDIWVQEQEVLSSYVRNEVEQQNKRAQSMLIPSRGDASVSGQMKIAIDVALTLPLVKQTDDVLVVGSANVHGPGESYDLLAGSVHTVTCVDPQEIEQTYDLNGTTYDRHKDIWEDEHPMVADVVLADAFCPGKGTIIGPVEARVYSLKVTADDPQLYDKWDVGGKKFEYLQLSTTVERRLTSHAREYHAPIGRLGNCAACREVDSIWPLSYDFSPTQLETWRKMHRYGPKNCDLLAKCVGKVVIHDSYPCLVQEALSCMPFRYARYIKDIIGGNCIKYDHDKNYRQVIVFSYHREPIVIYVIGELMPDAGKIGRVLLSVSPDRWEIYCQGIQIDKGTGLANLFNAFVSFSV